MVQIGSDPVTAMTGLEEERGCGSFRKNTCTVHENLRVGRVPTPWHAPSLQPLKAQRRGAASPVEQQVQHLLGGGKGPVSAQEDGDVGGVIALES